jgi:hypothetical protein
MIDEVFACHGRVALIDIGGTRDYWNLVPQRLFIARNIHITVVNLPGQVTSSDEEHFAFIEGDGCDLSHYPDTAFHIAHSNSVIEHVGDWDRMVAFAHEVSRVADKYFIQTPNYWFPIEPHAMTPFFHWLPKPMRVWLVLRFALGHWTKAATVGCAVRTVESARLLSKRMFRELFQDAEIRTERVGLFAKSFVAVRQ